MQSVMSNLVWSAVRCDFPREAADRVRRLLETRCGEALPGSPGAHLIERIQLAVLKLADGDEERLESTVASAECDWRDVLVAAGFGDDTTAHIRWATEAK